MPMPELHTAPALSHLCGIFYQRPGSRGNNYIIAFANSIREGLISLPLPGLADGSLAAEPGGDNSTQEITVEKQRAVHFSSVAMP